MQWIAVRHLLAGIEVKPALPAFVPGSRIPRDTQTLKPTLRKWDEILLHREDSEGVPDRVILQLAVGPVSANVELVVLLVETRCYSVFAEAGVCEVAKDRVVTRQLHGEGVMGMTPRLCLFGMTRGTTLLADVG
jgi:hypothetical protein